MNTGTSWSLESAGPVRRWFALAAWLLLCFGPAILGGLFRPDEWYASLNKPTWNPPGWVFGPVWTTLYTMMAIAAWIVWKQGGFRVQRLPLTAFLVQLILNALWSPLFFGWHRPGWALVDILLLWLAVLATILTFRPVSRGAAWLLAPYLAWVSFASVLNFTLWKWNA